MLKKAWRTAAEIAIVGCVLVLAGMAAAEAGAGDGANTTTRAVVQSRPNVPKNLAGLSGPFDLAGEMKPEVRYYIQETKVISLGFNGKRLGIDTYTVKMRLVPASLSGKGGDEWTVREFRVRSGEEDEATIPGLAGWSYIFREQTAGIDDQGQVFGIPHKKFESLTTSRGGTLVGPAAYPVYNSFIDFHSFCDVFARPHQGGVGVEGLKNIGQNIRHASAFLEAPVNLGTGIKKGSVFRNGDIRLAFKGVGLVDGAACAIIGYDSGESTLKMIIPISADQDAVTEGGSEYLGDIYVDLETRWVRKVTLDEFVVLETKLPATAPAGQSGSDGQGQKIQSYAVRHILTRMVSRAEYER